jgi:glycerate 2-kinase
LDFGLWTEFMPLKILIIPDKFKGTLPAGAAARAIANGWRKARPHDSLDLLPMTDGGDGFGEVISSLLHAKVQRRTTVDAAHRPCSARWWWEPERRIAIIESAAVIGLAMLPAGRFHPFELDTFGLGAVIRAAAAKGAKRCLMGIGGSATNDGGFGLARALGWEFLDRHASLIEQWTGLDKLAKIHAPSSRRFFSQLLVAVDVQNPLLGPRGATRVYGPQKGLRPPDFERAERCLRRLAQVAKTDFGRDLARAPGAGAAGGLGFGLLAFLGARLESGFDLFARQGMLERHLHAADLIIVGEGAIDSSTFMGKGVGQIAARCREQGIPCVALAGVVSASAKKRRIFMRTYALTELTAAEQAKANPAYWLERLAALVARSWTGSPIQRPRGC